MSFKVGDTFPMNLWTYDNGCEAMGSRDGLPSFCSLKAGHEGPHVEADGHFVIVNVWDEL